MPKRPAVFRPCGAPAPDQARRQADRDRGSARARGYTPEWDRASADHRAEHPLCRYCETAAFGGEPRFEPATCTDHLYPQRRYPKVFWVRAYWVSSCDDCHDGPKQIAERRGHAALDALARHLGLDPLPPPA